MVRTGLLWYTSDSRSYSWRCPCLQGLCEQLGSFSFAYGAASMFTSRCSVVKIDWFSINSAWIVLERSIPVRFSFQLHRNAESVLYLASHVPKHLPDQENENYVMTCLHVNLPLPRPHQTALRLDVISNNPEGHPPSRQLLQLERTTTCLHWSLPLLRPHWMALKWTRTSSRPT